MLLFAFALYLFGVAAGGTQHDESTLASTLKTLAVLVGCGALGSLGFRAATREGPR